MEDMKEPSIIAKLKEAVDESSDDVFDWHGKWWEKFIHGFVEGKFNDNFKIWLNHDIALKGFFKMLKPLREQYWLWGKMVSFITLVFLRISW